MGRCRVIKIISILVLAAGILLLIFPYIAQWAYRQNVNHIIREYHKEISDNSSKNDEEKNADDGTDASIYIDFDALYSKMKAYNKEIYENGQSDLKDPFSYEQPSFDLTEYGFLENMIGYIDIPRINEKLPIYLGATQLNMSKGAVHLSQTSLPIGGKNTNAVIAAHRGMSTAALFRHIDKILIGDEIYITNFRESLTYRVVEYEVINPSDIKKVLIQEGKDMVTLFSCHPYLYNNQRYVVYCERVI